MVAFHCGRFPHGVAHIRTVAGIVDFHDGRADVNDPTLADALRQVPAVFEISEDQPDGSPPPTGDLALIEQVPAGSVADVLAWVGDDLERAAAALTAEQARGVPARSTLVAALGKLAAEE